VVRVPGQQLGSVPAAGVAWLSVSALPLAWCARTLVKAAGVAVARGYLGVVGVAEFYMTVSRRGGRLAIPHHERKRLDP
jgi:hypothetical protein